MTTKVEETKIDDRGSLGKVLLDNEACTVLSLSEHPSLAQDAEREQLMECCAPCPSYTTVPCSC